MNTTKLTHNIGKALGGFFLAATLMVLPSNVDAQTITLNFDGFSNSSGNLLDGFNANTATPTTIASPESPGLNVTFLGLTGGGAFEVNGAALGFGVDSTAVVGDDNDAFDSALTTATGTISESVTISFDQTIAISSLNLTTLGPNDVFQFGPLTLVDADTNGASTDVVVLPAPVTIAANTPILIQATAGTVGLNDITFDIVETASVPEPSSACLLVGLGLCGLMRRRR